MWCYKGLEFNLVNLLYFRVNFVPEGGARGQESCHNHWDVPSGDHEYPL